ncbi:hypothetical protein CVT24_012150 [Panaeolus cyanescens]|uniref:Uncharacterized protein n=1 Tax=Panaeolus cyanescens TaxID=181874 RepID=A0A409X305_9AGAR|nr:hypothetical protein CVT24_012150 [Panaeolus cyanescens]
MSLHQNPAGTLRTRSGREYTRPCVQPIRCSTDFQLSAALEEALAVENDSTCFDIDDFQGGPFVEASPFWAAPTSTCAQDGISELEEGEVEEVEGSESEEGEEGEIDETEQRLTSTQKHKRAYRHRRQQAQFNLKQHLPDANQILKHVGGANPIDIDVDLENLPFASCAFQGVDMPKSQSKALLTFDALLQKGYRVVKHLPGTTQPLVDSNTNKVFAVAVGLMDDPSYAESASKAFAAVDETRKQLEFSSKESVHRRGNFTAVNYGVSYGQGSKVPHWLKCPHEAAVQRLLQNQHIIRLATFANQSDIFATWAPKAYQYYDTKVRELSQAMPHLKWPFWNSVWLCVTFNFGPNVCCVPHRDFLNLPFGWCCIIALGVFDHTRGGHLVLHDLKLLIEFPPGSLILIPSALLTHANTPVGPTDRRISFTQFCSGGIFRFIENGFKSEADLKRTDEDRYAEMMEAKAGRKDFGLSLWSTQQELLGGVVA